MPADTPAGARWLEHAPDAVLLLDPDWRVRWRNAAAEALATASGLAGLGADARALFVPVAPASWPEVATSVGQAGAWRGLLARAGDRPGQLDVSVATVTTDRGACRLLVIARDVTSLLSERRYLTDEVETLRTVLDVCPSVIVVEDAASGTCRFVNRAYSALTGVAAADVVGRRSLDVGLVDAETARRLRRQALTEGRLDHEGLDARPPSGETRHGILSTQLAETPAGTLAVSNWQDVTELKRAEQALIEANLRYERVVSLVPSVIWSAELDDDGTWQNAFISPVADRVLGVPPGTLGNDLVRFLGAIHPDDLDEAMTVLMEGATTPGLTRSHQYRVVRPDGEVLWLRTVGSSFINAKGRFEVFGVTEDVTEQERSQVERDRLADQLRQAQKLESVGRLAGGVAHDFNNLLTVILGNADHALADVPAHLHLRGMLEQIRKAAESAASLTRQLLAFSRQQVIAPRVLDLDALVVDLQRMLGRLLGEDIALETVTQAGEARVRADSAQLEQVIVNLAVNARDAMPEGGTLTIRTCTLHVDEAFVRAHPEARPGEFVVLAVRDTGTGMTEEVRQRVFDPFFTTKPRGQGTGLGLAMAYGAVEQHGGFIVVESAPGAGATFRIFLPRADEDAVQAMAGRPQEKLAPTGAETILLVEDNAAVRDLAERTLRRLGYEVVSCADGRQAMDVAATLTTTIDLLLTDVVMPGMGGDALAAALCAERPDLRVVFTSGYAEGLAESGPDGRRRHFLPKPYTPATLAQKVREVLDAS